MLRTIEQPTLKKIEVIGEQVIIAGTGYVGHMQRFAAVVKTLWDDKAFQGKPEPRDGWQKAERTSPEELMLGQSAYTPLGGPADRPANQGGGS